jgi:excinuclease ABC subunit B
VTKDRRERQMAYNQANNITPRSVQRAVQESLASVLKGRELAASVLRESAATMDVMDLLRELEEQMLAASANLDYEKAALLRDQMLELKEQAGLAKIEPKTKPIRYGKKAGKAAARKG